MSSPVENAGCVIFLIDESAAMDSPLQEEVDAAAGQHPKTKAAAVATALNACLKQLTAGPDFEVALVGYRTDSAGEARAESRWGGPLAGRDFVALSELAQHPLTVENRVRRVPNPTGIGAPREEAVSFPIWYVPQLGAQAPQIKAFQHCRELLANWLAAAGPNPGAPLVVHIFAGGSADGNPQQAITQIQQLEGSPLVFQVHLSASKTVPAVLYPANRAYVPLGTIRDLFERSSLLPAPLVEALNQAHVSAHTNARGMLYNAKMLDLVRFLALVKAQTQNWPPRRTGPAEPIAPAPEPEAAPAAAIDETSEEVALTFSDSEPSVESEVPSEKVALVVFLLNRGVEDPFSGDMKNPCARLQEHANDLLGKLAKSGGGMVDAAVVSYGLDTVGEVEVRTTFEGSLAGQSFVRDADLTAGALRIDEFEQQVPNGVGGLITIPVKRQIFVELDPTPAASPVPAFRSVRQLLADWNALHPGSCVPPVVLHLTRSALDSAALEEAAAQLATLEAAAGPARLYHLVVTEQPHRSLAYPGTNPEFEQPALQKIWELTSPLLGREELSVSDPAIVSVESRGMVVNGKFDRFLEGIQQALAR